MSDKKIIRPEWIPSAYREVDVEGKSTARPVTAPSGGSTHVKGIYKRKEKLAKGRK